MFASGAMLADPVEAPSAAARFGQFDFTRKRVKLGESLYRAGSPFDSLFAIRCGFFKSSAVLADGRDWVTGFHMGGEILGMDGIGTGRHASDAIALEDSEVGIIPYGRLDEPRLHRELNKVMSRELVRDQGVMLLLATMNAEERVAAFLLNLSQRLKTRGYSAAEFNLRMTREEMGSYLGMKLETVSRMFSKLHKDELVETHGKQIRIVDFEGLAVI
jgi:CRP/FNR family transcriptional regulator